MKLFYRTPKLECLSVAYTPVVCASVTENCDTPENTWGYSDDTFSDFNF